MSVRFVVLFAVIGSFACNDGRTGPERPDTGLDAPGFDTGPIGPGTDSGEESCIDRARWVYLVDSDRTLIRFEPDTLSFHTIGTLDCDASTTPFSMAVDRDATAWVLHQNGGLYAASTIDASCNPTSFTPHQNGFELFGMGFVGDESGETLFVSGGRELAIGTGNARLGTIDMGTLRLDPVGSATLPGWPELTGTGAGDLWAFFPDTNPPTASRLDQTTAAPVQTFQLDAIPFDAPRAWAFAFWGARYYIFLQSGSDPSTNVWRLDPSTSVTERVLENTGLRIVGAGVSTCAPTELI